MNSTYLLFTSLTFQERFHLFHLKKTKNKQVNKQNEGCYF